MKQLGTAVSAILDKVASLLKTEPARAIGYGSAVIVYLAVLVLNARGITRFGENLSFEEAVTATGSAIATVIVVIESIRRFVYSPQTYIEELSDEAQLAHEAAHLEDDMRTFIEGLKAAQDRREEEQPATQTFAVGEVKPGKSN